MNAAQIFVGAVSLVVIAAPFWWWLKAIRGDAIDKSYAPMWLAVGFLALFWVGLTGIALIGQIGAAS